MKNLDFWIFRFFDFMIRFFVIGIDENLLFGMEIEKVIYVW